MTSLDVLASDAVRLDVAAYYHQPAKLEFLLDAVVPQVRLARRWGLAAHVERHWLHGPHLRIRLAGPCHVLPGIADQIARAVTGHLAAAPSRRDVTDTDLLTQSYELGRRELVPAPYEPIHPDNTVRVEPVDTSALAALIGGGAAVAHREELLRRGVDALDVSGRYLLTRGNTAQARIRLALTAMSVHAAAYPFGLASGYITFLSHVEDFLHESDPDGRVRRTFERAWRGQDDTITAAVRRITDGAPDPLGDAWSRWVRDAWDVCGPAYDRGDLPLLPKDEYAHRAAGFTDTQVAARWAVSRDDVSEFHRRLASFDFTSGVAAQFGPYRFATNVLYQLLVVCGVTPLERYLAAYLLAEAAQRLTGESWQDAMDEHLAFLAAKR